MFCLHIYTWMELVAQNRDIAVGTYTHDDSTFLSSIWFTCHRIRFKCSAVCEETSGLGGRNG